MTPKAHACASESKGIRHGLEVAEDSCPLVDLRLHVHVRRHGLRATHQHRRVRARNAERTAFHGPATGLVVLRVHYGVCPLPTARRSAGATTRSANRFHSRRYSRFAGYPDHPTFPYRLRRFRLAVGADGRPSRAGRLTRPGVPGIRGRGGTMVSGAAVRYGEWCGGVRHVARRRAYPALASGTDGLLWLERRHSLDRPSRSAAHRRLGLVWPRPPTAAPKGDC